jgi:hypothetical protein
VLYVLRRGVEAMNGLMVIFAFVLALVLAAVCGLLGLRSLGALELPESPPFPCRSHCRQPISPPDLHEKI